jgi:hypothetical protein
MTPVARITGNLHARRHKPRMYEPIWTKIKENYSDAPVKVKCPVNNQARVIKAVKNLKAEENVLRRNVDAVGFGKLIIRQEGDYIYFQLTYNGDQV